ncbi:MAG: hypothetical protein AB1609_19780, partial [Bacillota bacterium]
MGSPFDVFPEAETLALAGIVIHREPFIHQLSPFVHIVPRQGELDEVYLPRVKGVLSFFEPTHYLVGAAPDDRYFQTRREIRTIQDAQSSITLAHQALCIYHCCPYVMGPILGFQKAGSVPLVLQVPATGGANWELEDVAFCPPSAPFFPWHGSNPFDDGLNQFFEALSLAYSQVKDRRWIIS